jgi:hypothetical protein
MYKMYIITGTAHGAIYDEITEGAARRRFHKDFNGESIIFIKVKEVENWL